MIASKRVSGGTEKVSADWKHQAKVLRRQTQSGMEKNPSTNRVKGGLRGGNLCLKAAYVMTWKFSIPVTLISALLENRMHLFPLRKYGVMAYYAVCIVKMS